MVTVVVVRGASTTRADPSVTIRGRPLPSQRGEIRRAEVSVSVAGRAGPIRGPESSSVRSPSALART